MIKEVCIGNFADIPRMIAAGANRIELNADLSSGGVTPSFGVIKESVKVAHEYHVPIIIMLRPRGGNFIYSDQEFEIMKNDLQCIALLGADGIAVGCLTEDGLIDRGQMGEILQIATAFHLEVVMHMAFDEIPLEQQSNEMEWLINHHVTRILTHGGSLTSSIEECVPHLKELVKKADGRIQILPGGGINVDNVQKIEEQLNVYQAHGTKIVLMK